MSTFRKLEKESQVKPEVSRRKEIIELILEINDIKKQKNYRE